MANSNNIEERDILDEEILEERHQELVQAVKGLYTALSKEDPELKSLLKDNLGIVSILSEIIQKLDRRISILENKPQPVRLKAQRNRESGEIEYVVIEYNKK